jgi:hypothetical protein
MSFDLPSSGRSHPPAGWLVDWVTTVDHKRVGILYIVTSVAISLVAGILELIVRLELAQPGSRLSARPDSAGGAATAHLCRLHPGYGPPEMLYSKPHRRDQGRAPRHGPAVLLCLDDGQQAPSRGCPQDSHARLVIPRETTDHWLFAHACLFVLIIYQSGLDRSKEDQHERGLARTCQPTCDDVARREGLEPPTARSVVWCSIH